MIEMNAPFDESTLGVAAIFVNKFQVNRNNSIIRVTFGENGYYRAAVAMSLAEATDLKDALETILNLKETIVNEQVENLPKKRGRKPKDTGNSDESAS